MGKERKLQVDRDIWGDYRMASVLEVSIGYALGVREGEIYMLVFENSQRVGQDGKITNVEVRPGSRCVHGCLG